MNHSPAEGRTAHLALTPMRRYNIRGGWEDPVGKSLASPASDGTVIYYFDSLGRGPVDDDGDEYLLGFDEMSARATCQYLYALAVRKGVQIADGPYLQVLEDDGAVPPGWVMLRALIWVDEYDVLVPSTSSAHDDAGLPPTESSIGPAGLGAGVV